MEIGSQAVPGAFEVLYVLYSIGSPVDVKDIHRIVDRLSKLGLCCREYRFASYPWGPYSKDLESDLEILRSTGLVIITNGDGAKRVMVTSKGVEVAKNVERLIRNSGAISSLLRRGDRAGDGNRKGSGTS